MARGGGETGESSAKRAKADGADNEEEDPLVLRKEEVVRLLEESSAEGKDNARAKKELSTLCAELEAKNEKSFGGCRLPPDLWQKILDENLHQNDLLALAMTCRFFREKQKDLGWKVETELNTRRFLELRRSGKMASHSFGWFQWVYDTFEILPGFKWYEKRVKGAVHEDDLLNYAAFQGSVEILRWLVEEKGWKLNEDIDWYAGLSGSVEVLEYLRERGYVFDGRATCDGAAQGGFLKALKFLRGLDPPCPWNEETCWRAAEGGHLDVLKWARSQDPPCPWHWRTCSEAAKGGRLDVLKWLRSQDPPCPLTVNVWDSAEAAKRGHLEVLKWLRDQDPPCPWNWMTCSYAAKAGHLDVLKWARAQDPPCPWSEATCVHAVLGGHLEILKWLRSQDPPCPWGEETCADAAEGGHLDVLKWARSQDPPCPWSRSRCKKKASWYGHQHVIDWIDQREDESDVEPFDSDTDRSYDSYGDDYF